jgi:hypothetical protein
MNVKIETEATQFLVWEHINEIFVAMQLWIPYINSTVSLTRLDFGLFRKSHTSTFAEKRRRTLPKTREEARANNELWKEIF